MKKAIDKRTSNENSIRIRKETKIKKKKYDGKQASKK